MEVGYSLTSLIFKGLFVDVVAVKKVGCLLWTIKFLSCIWEV